jgi:hypothetical protein
MNLNSQLVRLCFSSWGFNRRHALRHFFVRGPILFIGFRDFGIAERFIRGASGLIENVEFQNRIGLLNSS